jgi:hypothetical protein
MSPPPGPVLSTTPISDVGYRDETSVAVDPRAPSTVIAVYQTPATVARSTDGAATWSKAVLPGVQDFELSGDPEAMFDDDGHAYALYIAFDPPADYDTLGARAHRNGIFVNRSDDGGRTWWPAATAVIQQPERAGIPFEDKPMMALDRSADPSRHGRLYVAWTEFRRRESVILFSRSTDGGHSFSLPVEISDRAGSPKDSVGADEGTDVAVSPQGDVYVVWSDSAGIRLDRSTDGGISFGPDRLVATTPDIVFGVPGVERANGYPSLEIDRLSGRLYVVWSDVRLGRPAVFIATSDDGGANWSAPMTIGGSPRDDGTARFFAWASADPITGLLAVGYYRAQRDGRLDYALAWSTDRGATFHERGWGASFAPRGAFLGDYTGVDALDAEVYGAWTEVPRGGQGSRHETQVIAGRASFR